jgi:hypothetical protein
MGKLVTRGHYANVAFTRMRTLSDWIPQLPLKEAQSNCYRIPPASVELLKRGFLGRTNYII